MPEARSALVLCGLVWVVLTLGTEAERAPHGLGVADRAGRPLRAWLDLSSYLPQGTLHQVELEVDRFDSKPPPMIQLQLWARTDTNEDSTIYALKWQTSVLLTKGHTEPYKVMLSPGERVSVEESDKLGWVSHAESVRVTSSFDESYGALLYTLEKDEKLRVGHNYTFDGLVHPHSFALTPVVKQMMANWESIVVQNALT